MTLLPTRISPQNKAKGNKTVILSTVIPTFILGIFLIHCLQHGFTGLLVIWEHSNIPICIKGYSVFGASPGTVMVEFVIHAYFLDVIQHPPSHSKVYYFGRQKRKRWRPELSRIHASWGNFHVLFEFEICQERQSMDSADSSINFEDQ